jgi:hypothetical protein
VYRSRIPSKAFLDFLYVLISPGIMFLSSIIFAIAPALLGWTLATGVFTWNEPRLWIFLSAIYLLMFGPPIFYGAAYARHREDVSKIHAFALAHVVPLYTYVWYVAVWRALFRMVLRRNSWAKTDRHVELSPPVSVGVVPEEGASR